MDLLKKLMKLLVHVVVLQSPELCLAQPCLSQLKKWLVPFFVIRFESKLEILPMVHGIDQTETGFHRNRDRKA